jgi:hypothetical protein
MISGHKEHGEGAENTKSEDMITSQSSYQVLLSLKLIGKGIWEERKGLQDRAQSSMNSVPFSVSSV